jgi:tetratricopeptide (TPR) repeat protein
VGAVHAELWTPLQKVLFASVGTVMYVAKLFVPIHLAAVYPLPATSATHYATGYYVAPFVVLAGLIATLIVGQRLRPVLFGVAFFFINIILVLQLLSVGVALLAERYTYIPYIGLFFALAWWLDEPAGSPRARWNPAIAGICLVLVPLSLVQTWNRCHVFHDPETFWNDAIDKYPRKIVDGYYNRANYLVEHGRLEPALEDYNRALDLNAGVARIWYNKGVLLAKMDRVDSALVSFDHVIALDPKHLDALNNRGAMRYKKGDLEGAIADFSRILELNPRYREAYMNLAVAHADRKEYEKTVQDVQRGIALEPANPANEEEYGLLGQALQHLGRSREALPALDRAIGGSPPNASTLGLNYFYRSMAHASLGDREHALADVLEAQRHGTTVDPNYVRSLRKMPTSR